MKTKSLFLLVLFAVVLGTAAFGQATALAVTLSKQELPLRLSEPTDVIIADLENYILDYMQDKNIPGAAIVLIRDNEIVWTEGFGVALLVGWKNKQTAWAPSDWNAREIPSRVARESHLGQKNTSTLGFDHCVLGTSTDRWLCSGSTPEPISAFSLVQRTMS